MKKVFFLSLILLISIYSQPKIPDLTLWATDLTSTLTQKELSDLNNRLKIYEDSTSNQIVFLMINSLEDYPIDMLAYDIATKNKIGKKNRDNGILILLAKEDRKIDIEVGYGLEGAVPDAIASSIIRNVMIPELKNGNYYNAINNGIDAIIKAIGGEYKADENNPEDSDLLYVLIIIIFIILWFTINRGGRTFIPGGIYRGSNSGWSSGGWSGGSGGSSFGGFSGGGGSFGGGGASGSW